jgi:hypothetical protein
MLNRPFQDNINAASEIHLLSELECLNQFKRLVNISSVCINNNHQKRALLQETVLFAAIIWWHAVCK